MVSISYNVVVNTNTVNKQANTRMNARTYTHTHTLRTLSSVPSLCLSISAFSEVGISKWSLILILRTQFDCDRVQHNWANTSEAVTLDDHPFKKCGDLIK